MKRLMILASLALAACVHVPPTDRALICTGPRQDIPDNDPALRLFEGSLEDRKIALAIERINGCD